MKYGIFAFLIIFMVSCSNQESEQSIKDKITSYKKEVGVLNQKIAALESKLKTVDPAGDEAIEQIPVEVQEISLEPFSHYIQVSGSAEAVKEAFISPEMAGQIREIYVKEGDHVTKGQLLAKLNSDIAESSIADLEYSLALAVTVYEKQSRLWANGIGSEIQYLNAKTNKETLEQKLVTLKAQLDMAMVKSPVNGIVDVISRKVGEMAMPGAQFMQVVNLEEIYINADVSEVYLGQISEGETVKVEFPVYPDMSLNVPIYRKGNIINPNNRTFPIQLKISNPDHKLKPNILAVINIRDFSADSAVVVPSAIIKQDMTGSYLYTAQQDGDKIIAKKEYINPGKFYHDKTMVTDGIKPGQKVIVQGYNEVSDGTQVYIKPNNAS
jgi:membrane fusion protein, multidrug efflux system